MSPRRLRWPAAVLAFAMLFWSVAPAYAFLEDDPKAVSSTNPNDPGDPKTWWRAGWGNSLTPDIQFTSVPKDPIPGSTETYPTLGFLYTLDRRAPDGSNVPSSAPTTGSASPYLYLSPLPGGSFLKNTFDLQAIEASAPVGEWGYTPPPGQSVPVEGEWWLHLRFFNTVRIQGADSPFVPGVFTSPAVDNYMFNVDVTPPTPVTNFGSGVTSPTVSPRRVFSWDGVDTDALSGVAMWRILINGQEKGFVPYEPWVMLPPTFTIEDLPTGHSLVQIEAMDRAGNLSAPVGEDEYVDATGAKVTITNPAKNGDTVEGTCTFSVDATDAIGLKDVRFVLDGSEIASRTTPPYRVDFDTTTRLDGAHQLQVFADDLLGRFAYDTRTFVINNAGTPVVPPDLTLESSPSVTMLSHDIQNSPTLFWTDSLLPSVTFTSVNGTSVPASDGYYYLVDRTAGSIPTTASDSIAGNPVTTPIDMFGMGRVFPSPLLSGESTAAEGADWHIHLRSYVSGFNGLSAKTADGRFGIDVTPPSAVESLTSDVATWTDVLRHRITWKDKVYELHGPGAVSYPFATGYDSLSGDAAWVLSVNGGSASTWPRYAFSPLAIATLESGLKSGVNTVTVQVKDFAGNVSAPSSTIVRVDTDTPTAVAVSPAEGSTLHGSATFALTADDQAGISHVQFFVDGGSRQDSSATAMTLDTRTLTDASHTWSAVVYDMFGHTASVSGSFVVDNAAEQTLDSTPTATLGSDTTLDESATVRWTNTVAPMWQFSAVDAGVPSVGFFYGVDRFASTVPTTGSDSTLRTSPLTQQQIYMPDIASSESTAVEGDDWYMHVRSYAARSALLSTATAQRFGVDIMPPTPVENLAADVATWTSVLRHRITWDDKVFLLHGAGLWTYPLNRGYDALSGDWGWRLTVNGGMTIDSQRFGGSPVGAATIETGLHSGVNTVTVQAIDNAGNVSAPTPVNVRIDTDTPTVAFTAPDPGVTLTGTHPFVVHAADSAGISHIRFTVDSTPATDSASATFMLDTRGVFDGTHTVTAQVWDMIGNTASTVTTFVADNARPMPIDSTATVSMAGVDLASGPPLYWTNSAAPSALFGSLRGPGITTNGYFFTVDRTPSTVPTLGAQAVPEANPTFQTLDMNAYGALHPATLPGANSNAEGDDWYVHLRAYSSLLNGLSASTTHGHFAVDVTPPSPVEGLTSDVSTWTESLQHVISWTDKVYLLHGAGVSAYPMNQGYDSLSGDKSYRMTVNGGTPLTWDRFTGVATATAFAAAGNGVRSGVNTVAVQVIDTAGNISAPAYTLIRVDAASPTVSITSPAVGAEISGRWPFSVDARDDAGISNIAFSIDGTTVLSSLTSAFTLASGAYADGTHTVDVTVHDMFGHSAETSRTFIVNNASASSLESTPSVTMFGEDIQDPHVLWFTNSVTPTFQFAAVTDPGLVNTGFYYMVDRSAASTPNLASDVAPQDTPLTQQQIDMSGISRSYPGTQSYESTAVEGDDWHIHVRSFCATSSGGLSAAVADGHFGIDVTPPTAVENLSADVSTWTDVMRHRISWKDKVWEIWGPGAWQYPFNRGYDALSGDHQWRLTVNDGDPIQWDRFVGSPTGVATVETGLRSGVNTIAVQVVDTAGNASAPSFVNVRIDTDTPSVSIAAPPAGSTLRDLQMFSVNASDAAGISRVLFTIDTIPVQDSLATTLAIDTRSLGDGSHDLTVQVWDMFGHQSSTSRTFGLDNTSLVPLDSTPTVSVSGGVRDDAGRYWWNFVTPFAGFGSIDGRDQATGFFYNVDRSAVSTPTRASDASPRDFPLTQQELDMLGLSRLYPGVLSSESTPVEGDDWYVHVRAYSAWKVALSASVATTNFGIDVTPPTPITNLASDVGGWTSVLRHRLTWDNKLFLLRGAGVWPYPLNRGYDALSGDWGWRLTVNDGAPIDSRWDVGSPVGAATIETGLHSGVNTVTVQAIDNAGNVSAPTPVNVRIDTDTPTVAFTAPDPGVTLTGTHPFVVHAADSAGISHIRFTVDSTVAADSASPTLTLDTRSLFDGTHSVTAQVWDMIGNTASAVTTFVADNARPMPIDSTATVSMAGVDLASGPPLYWTNSAVPSALFGSLRGPGINTNGYFFTVDRTPSTVPTMGADSVPEASPTFQTLDMNAYGALHPATLPGANSNAEGDDWYVHLRAYSSLLNGLSASTTHGHFGVDVTPPSAVENLTSDVSGWTESMQHTVSWADKVYRLHGAGVSTYPMNQGYDSLSGDKSYRMTVNNGTPVTWDRFTGVATATAIVSNGLRSGVNTIAVQVIDVAGNVSAASNALIRIDADTPTVSITSPMAGATVTGLYLVSVDAQDAAGISRVQFTIDGGVVQDSTATTMTLDAAGLANGGHTLSVTVWDMYGHWASDTHAFRSDNAVLPGIDSTATVSMAGQDISSIPTLLWTNSYVPQVTFGALNGPGVTTNAFYYTVDRSPVTAPTLASEVVAQQNPTNQTLDMRTYGRLHPATKPSESVDAEGDDWYVHVRTYSSAANGMSRSTTHGHFAVDVTPPTAVEGLASDSGGSWTESLQHSVWWIDKVFQLHGPGVSQYPFNEGYDALSGDKAYRMSVNDGAPVTWDRLTSALFAMQTVTNGLRSGVNTVTVQVVDTAGNVSAPSSTNIYIDQTAPTVSITSPPIGQVVSGVYPMTVIADDDAGISAVTFVIDGVTRQTSASSTYQLDSSSLADGSHTLVVTARDMFGHVSAPASRTFTVDNTTRASLDSTPSVRMNGFDIMDPAYIWFSGTASPTVEFSAITGPGLVPTGFYYVVDRSAGTVPSVRSDVTPAGSPMTMHTLDMAGLGKLHPATKPNESSDIEGDDWFIHVRSYCATATGGLSGFTATGHFGVDLTPPMAVQGLKSDVSGWTDVFRHRITWTDMVFKLHGPGSWLWPESQGYDALSGDHQWKLTVNGGTPTLWDRSVNTAEGAVTVENGLVPGKNKISIQVVDHAGNSSAPSSVYIYVDRDTPTVSVAKPSSSTWISGKYPFSVAAADQGGIRSITFAIDGSNKQSTTSKVMTYDTHRLSDGSHTLKVSVKDMFGHVRTTYRTFHVDNTHIRFTSLADSPDPFYPVLHDGYKDTTRISAYMSEAAKDLYLQVFDSAGTLIRQMHWSNVSAGLIRPTWDGKNSSGRVRVGTFSYRFAAYDRAGNYSATSMPTSTIRNYEVIRLSNGTVRVVRR